MISYTEVQCNVKAATHADEAALWVGTSECRLGMHPGLELLHGLDLLKLRYRASARHLRRQGAGAWGSGSGTKRSAHVR